MMRKFLAGLVLFGAVTTGLTLATDSGRAADVAAVRAAEIKAWQTGANPMTIDVTSVHVVGDYALVHWQFGQTTGMESAYKRASGEDWKRILHNGGSISMSDLMHHGVPSAIAHELTSKP